MKIKRNMFLVVLAMVLTIVLSQDTFALFTSTEPSNQNGVTAWVSQKWLQTSQSDFDDGVYGPAYNTDITTSSGNVQLALVANPTLIDENLTEVYTQATSYTLMKTITFTKSGATYNELRVDANLRATANAYAYMSIRFDGVQKFWTRTTSGLYQNYSVTFNTSAASDGPHSVTLWLYTTSSAKKAWNSIFRVYRTKTYATSGTIASAVWNTSTANGRWDALGWTETLPANSDITFEVRAQNSSFAKDAVSPAWLPVPGDSILQSISQPGQYKQWRATLTSTDPTRETTPVLSDVSMFYHYRP